MHIGICDDEENVRAYIRKLIEQQNEECQITEYASGEELLQAEKENSEKIDVLFLDIAMGDIDGMSVAKQLRQIQADKEQAAWGSLPLLIFVITSLSSVTQPLKVCPSHVGTLSSTSSLTLNVWLSLSNVPPLFLALPKL